MAVPELKFKAMRPTHLSSTVSEVPPWKTWAPRRPTPSTTTGCDAYRPSGLGPGACVGQLALSDSLCEFSGKGRLPGKNRPTTFNGLAQKNNGQKDIEANQRGITTLE